LSSFARTSFIIHSILPSPVRLAGPAFIKWGQWAATRPDLFPPDLCSSLQSLQTKAPTHAHRHTVAAVERAFGAPIGELFSEFEQKPVASGSIAQVYRAQLSERGAQLAGTRTRGGLLPLRRKRLFKPGGDVAVKVGRAAAEFSLSLLLLSCRCLVFMVEPHILCHLCSLSSAVGGAFCYNPGPFL
jgi:predicted unusual protein kinase regulating ubiquinone biosynthesis (AarF/ABC1/UbiB family)